MYKALSVIVCVFVFGGIIGYKVDKNTIQLKQKEEFIKKAQNENPIQEQKVIKPLKISQKELKCLALNVYYEARSQSMAGQKAVAFVTLNRKLNKRFPNDVCNVIKQGYRKGRRDCHFSWMCDGLSDRPRNIKAFHKAMDVALWTSNNYYEREAEYTEGSTHYHAEYIKKPWWAAKMIQVNKIDNHIFYY